VIDFRVPQEFTRGQSNSWWGKQSYKPRRKKANAPSGGPEPPEEEMQISQALFVCPPSPPRNLADLKHSNPLICNSRSQEYDFTAPPSQRQTFYQYCDISIPAAQKLLEKSRSKYHVRSLPSVIVFFVCLLICWNRMRTAGFHSRCKRKFER
jgi:hypothetical protein